MPYTLKPFQETVCDGLIARLHNVRGLHDQVRASTEVQQRTVRLNEAAVVLQAPTGAGKTLIACETLACWSAHERVLWFWFAPFAGLVEQAKLTLRAQAPQLPLLALAADRNADAVAAGGVFVTTWASVAASNANARKARSSGDDGQSLDVLVRHARAAGLRIGCVVDEAHHGFHKAAQARAFFTDVLAPDYALMMTATPRDSDVVVFEKDSGYRVGDVADWASVSRHDAVEAGLLKHGVRTVRFLANDDDAEQLIDFEHLALRECAAAHRQIKQALADAGIALTPLMLVQVPDGKAAQLKAAEYLTGPLEFAPGSVRVHTADEPDPDLIALAHDPSVEVLIFKMAVALGFDAPRAFTLAALRGARDKDFGVQVIGRIVRVHGLLQGRRDLPASLDYGYVFLANAQSQEGLLDAGVQINALRTQAPEIGTSTVFTVSGATAAVQLVRSGEPLALMLGPHGVEYCDAQGATVTADQIEVADTGLEALQPAVMQLFEFMGEASATNVAATGAGRVAALALTTPASAHRYPRRGGVPATLRSEFLPPAPADYEMQLADHVDFNATVLSSRLRDRAQIYEHAQDIFDDRHVRAAERELWAELSTEAVAGRAHAIVMRLDNINEREIRLRLLERFAKAIERSGAAVGDADELEDQLDLVLVRHPALLREAYKRLRQQQVVLQPATLAAELLSEQRLEPAQRNAYGVYPQGMNDDERRIAELIDRDPQVRWWHRNPVRTAGAVGLYAWDEGEGFFPDFVLALNGHHVAERIALLEVKGSQLWGVGKEPEKADAAHPDYGRVFMVGRGRGERDYIFLKRARDRLESDGAFSVDPMRW